MGNREIQAAFKTRMRDRGFIQVAEWIPASEREAFKQFAKELRERNNATDTSPLTSNETVTGNDPITSNNHVVTRTYKIVEEKREKPPVIYVRGVVEEKRENRFFFEKKREKPTEAKPSDSDLERIQAGSNPYLRSDDYLGCIDKVIQGDDEQSVMDD